jgi:hypothetical protein
MGVSRGHGNDVGTTLAGNANSSEVSSSRAWIIYELILSLLDNFSLCYVVLVERLLNIPAAN